MNAAKYSVFLLLAVSLEIREQIKDELTSSCVAPSEDPKPWFYERMYPFFLNSYGNGLGGHVVAIKIPKNVSTGEMSLCEGRSYMAKLLEVLTADTSNEPAVIAIDKYYSPALCTGEDGGPDVNTKALQTSLKAVKIPIVIAKSVDLKDPPENSVRIPDTCLVERGDPLTTPISGHLSYGLIRLNANLEQIPLQWSVMDTPPSRTVCIQQTLAFATARAAAKEKAAKGEVAKGDLDELLVKESRQPFGQIDTRDQNSESFQKNPGVIEHVSTEILLPVSPSPQSPKDKWVVSPGWNNQKILNMAVVIGAEDDKDSQTIFGKTFQGFELQAQYIAALLNHSYMRAASGWLLLDSFLFFIFLIEVVPFVSKYLKHKKGKQVSPILVSSWRWAILCGVVFIVGATAIPLLTKFLPPFLLLADFLFVTLTQCAIDRLEHYKEIMTEEEGAQA